MEESLRQEVSQKVAEIKAKSKPYADKLLELKVFASGFVGGKKSEEQEAARACFDETMMQRFFEGESLGFTDDTAVTRKLLQGYASIFEASSKLANIHKEIFEQKKREVTEKAPAEVKQKIQEAVDQNISPKDKLGKLQGIYYSYTGFYDVPKEAAPQIRELITLLLRELPEDNVACYRIVVGMGQAVGYKQDFSWIGPELIKELIETKEEEIKQALRNELARAISQESSKGVSVLERLTAIRKIIERYYEVPFLRDESLKNTVNKLLADIENDNADGTLERLAVMRELMFTCNVLDEIDEKKQVSIIKQENPSAEVVLEDIRNNKLVHVDKRKVLANASDTIESQFENAEKVLAALDSIYSGDKNPVDKLDLLNLLLGVALKKGVTFTGGQQAAIREKLHSVSKEVAREYILLARNELKDIDLEAFAKNPDSFNEKIIKMQDTIERMILKNTDINSSVLSLKQWLYIATQCLQEGDYHTAHVIVDALSRQAIQDFLKNPVAKKEKAEYEQLRNFYRPPDYKLVVMGMQEASQDAVIVPSLYAAVQLVGKAHANKGDTKNIVDPLKRYKNKIQSQSLNLFNASLEVKDKNEIKLEGVAAYNLLDSEDDKAFKQYVDKMAVLEIVSRKDKTKALDALKPVTPAGNEFISALSKKGAANIERKMDEVKELLKEATKENIPEALRKKLPELISVLEEKLQRRIDKIAGEEEGKIAEFNEDIETLSDDVSYLRAFAEYLGIKVPDISAVQKTAAEEKALQPTGFFSRFPRFLQVAEAVRSLFAGEEKSADKKVEMTDFSSISTPISVSKGRLEEKADLLGRAVVATNANVSAEVDTKDKTVAELLGGYEIADKDNKDKYPGDKIPTPNELTELCKYLMREEVKFNKGAVLRQSDPVTLALKNCLYELVRKAAPDFIQNVLKAHNSIGTYSDEKNREFFEVFLALIPKEIKEVFQASGISVEDEAQKKKAAENLMFVMRSLISKNIEPSMTEGYDVFQRIMMNMSTNSQYGEFLLEHVYPQIEAPAPTPVIEERSEFLKDNITWKAYWDAFIAVENELGSEKGKESLDNAYYIGVHKKVCEQLHIEIPLARLNLAELEPGDGFERRVNEMVKNNVVKGPTTVETEAAIAREKTPRVMISEPEKIDPREKEAKKLEYINREFKEGINAFLRDFYVSAKLGKVQQSFYELFEKHILLLAEKIDSAQLGFASQELREIIERLKMFMKEIEIINKQDAKSEFEKAGEIAQWIGRSPRFFEDILNLTSYANKLSSELFSKQMRAFQDDAGLSLDALTIKFTQWMPKYPLKLREYEDLKHHEGHAETAKELKEEFETFLASYNVIVGRKQAFENLRPLELSSTTSPTGATSSLQINQQFEQVKAKVKLWGQDPQNQKNNGELLESIEKLLTLYAQKLQGGTKVENKQIILKNIPELLYVARAIDPQKPSAEILRSLETAVEVLKKQNIGLDSYDINQTSKEIQKYLPKEGMLREGISALAKSQPEFPIIESKTSSPLQKSKTAPGAITRSKEPEQPVKPLEQLINEADTLDRIISLANQNPETPDKEALAQKARELFQQELDKIEAKESITFPELKSFLDKKERYENAGFKVKEDYLLKRQDLFDKISQYYLKSIPAADLSTMVVRFKSLQDGIKSLSKDKEIFFEYYISEFKDAIDKKIREMSKELIDLLSSTDLSALIYIAKNPEVFNFGGYRVVEKINILLEKITNEKTKITDDVVIQKMRDMMASEDDVLEKAIKLHTLMGNYFEHIGDVSQELYEEYQRNVTLLTDQFGKELYDLDRDFVKQLQIPEIPSEMLEESWDAKPIFKTGAAFKKNFGEQSITNPLIYKIADALYKNGNASIAVLMCHQLLSLCKKAAEQRDVHAMRSIFMVFDQSELKKTIIPAFLATCTEQEKAFFQSLQRIFDPAGNMKNIRKYQEEIEARVPYLGVWAQDIEPIVGRESKPEQIPPLLKALNNIYQKIRALQATPEIREASAVQKPAWYQDETKVTEQQSEMARVSMGTSIPKEMPGRLPDFSEWDQDFYRTRSIKKRMEKYEGDKDKQNPNIIAAHELLRALVEFRDNSKKRVNQKDADKLRMMIAIAEGVAKVQESEHGKTLEYQDLVKEIAFAKESMARRIERVGEFGKPEEGSILDFMDSFEADGTQQTALSASLPQVGQKQDTVDKRSVAGPLPTISNNKSSLADIVEQLTQNPANADTVFGKKGKYRAELLKIENLHLVEKMILVKGDNGDILREKIRETGLLVSDHMLDTIYSPRARGYQAAVDNKKLWQIRLKVLLNLKSAQDVLASDEVRALFKAHPDDAKTHVENLIKMAVESGNEIPVLRSALIKSGIFDVFEEKIKQGFISKLQQHFEDAVIENITTRATLDEKLQNADFRADLKWHPSQIDRLLRDVLDISDEQKQVLGALKESAENKSGKWVKGDFYLAVQGVEFNNKKLQKYFLAKIEKLAADNALPDVTSADAAAALQKYIKEHLAIVSGLQGPGNYSVVVSVESRGLKPIAEILFKLSADEFYDAVGMEKPAPEESVVKSTQSPIKTDNLSVETLKNTFEKVTDESLRIVLQNKIEERGREEINTADLNELNKVVEALNKKFGNKFPSYEEYQAFLENYPDFVGLFRIEELLHRQLSSVYQEEQVLGGAAALMGAVEVIPEMTEQQRNDPIVTDETKLIDLVNAHMPPITLVSVSEEEVRAALIKFNPGFADRELESYKMYNNEFIKKGESWYRVNFNRQQNYIDCGTKQLDTQPDTAVAYYIGMVDALSNIESKLNYYVLNALAIDRDIGLEQNSDFYAILRVLEVAVKDERFPGNGAATLEALVRIEAEFKAVEQRVLNGDSLPEIDAALQNIQLFELQKIRANIAERLGNQTYGQLIRGEFNPAPVPSVVPVAPTYEKLAAALGQIFHHPGNTLVLKNSGTVVLKGEQLKGISPEFRGTVPGGEVIIRYFSPGEKNTVKLDDLIRRINYLCDAANEINSNPEIKKIRDDYIGYARENFANIDTVNGKAFDEMAEDAKEKLLGLQKDLVRVVYPGMSLPKAIKELDKKLKEISVKDGRPTVVHVMADGMISANIPKFSTDLRHPAHGKSYPGTDRSGEVQGATPNSALEVTAYVNAEGNVDVKAAVSRSTSWSVLGKKGEKRQKLSYYQARAELVNLLSLMDFESGATVNIHSMMLLTPVYSSAVEGSKLVKLFYAGETEQAQNQVYSARMLDGKELVLPDGRRVTPNIAVTNTSVKNPKRFMGLNEEKQEQINNIGFAKFIKNQYESLRKAYPEHQAWLDANCYRKPTLGIIDLETKLKAAYEELLDALEAPRGKAAKAEVEKLEAQLSKAYGELYKDVKVMWKNNSPAIPAGVSPQFAYFADALKLYYYGDHVKKKTHAYLFVTAMTRANELAGVIVAKNCKTGKDRTKESLDQDNLALKYEHEHEGEALLSTSNNLLDYVSQNLQTVREHGTGQEVIKYTVPGGLPVSMKDNEWEKKPERKTSKMSKCHKVKPSLMDIFHRWRKSKVSPPSKSSTAILALEAEQVEMPEVARSPELRKEGASAGVSIWEMLEELEKERKETEAAELQEKATAAEASLLSTLGELEATVDKTWKPAKLRKKSAEASVPSSNEELLKGVKNEILRNAMAFELDRKVVKLAEIEASVLNAAIDKINEVINKKDIMPKEFLEKYAKFLKAAENIPGVNNLRAEFFIALIAQNKSPIQAQDFETNLEAAGNGYDSLNRLYDDIDEAAKEVSIYQDHIIAARTVLGEHDAEQSVLNGLDQEVERLSEISLSYLSQLKELTIKLEQMKFENKLAQANDSVSLRQLSEEVKEEIEGAAGPLANIASRLKHINGDSSLRAENQRMKLMVEQQKWEALKNIYLGMNEKINQKMPQGEKVQVSKETIETVTLTISMTREEVNASTTPAEKGKLLAAIKYDPAVVDKFETITGNDTKMKKAIDSDSHVIVVRNDGISYNQPKDVDALSKSQMKELVQRMVEEAFKQFKPTNYDEIKYEGSDELKKMAIKLMKAEITKHAPVVKATAVDEGPAKTKEPKSPKMLHSPRAEK